MPQLENGYTRLADELIEAYMKARIPGEAMQCLWVILRKTYGFNKLEDKIAISQFSKATGLKKQHAHRAVAKLISLNLVTKNGDGLIVTYSINKDSSTWCMSPKKVTYPKKVTNVPQNGDREYPKMVNTKENINTIKDIVPFLNKVTGKKFKEKAVKTNKLIGFRLKEGFTLKDFEYVIEVKSRQWLDDDKMSSYLRPETLFGNKFEGYLNENMPEKEIYRTVETKDVAGNDITLKFYSKEDHETWKNRT